MSNKQVRFIYLISTRTASKQKLINLSVIQNRHDRSMTCSVYECVLIQIRIRSPYQAATVAQVCTRKSENNFHQKRLHWKFREGRGQIKNSDRVAFKICQVTSEGEKKNIHVHQL